MTDQVRFEVGEKYENMKGVFEVIAIHRDSMDIRWEDGEEISTPIALQQRIIERMRHEKELEKAEAGKKSKKAKARSGKGAKPFSGLEDGDFGESVTKTVWRGRGQLGGAVARQLKSPVFKFNSWAVLSQPEVHWLDMKRQKLKTLTVQTKFYVFMGQTGLAYGLLLPKGQTAASDTSDWDRFLKWIQTPQNEDRLKLMCATQELYIYDKSGQGFTGTIEIDPEGAWLHRQPDGAESGVESISGFLDALDARETLDLRIEKQMKKSVAIQNGSNVAADLASLFMALLPLYTVAATGES